MSTNDNTNNTTINLSPEQLAEQRTAMLSTPKKSSGKKQQQSAQPPQQQPVQTQQAEQQAELAAGQNQTITIENSELQKQQFEQQKQNTQKAQQQNKELSAEEKQIDTMQKDGNLSVDTSGKPNVSRGIIGLVSDPSQAAYVTDGTVSDVVLPPSRFPNKEGKVNPVTQQDLENRIALERRKAGMDKERQNWLAIKMRTENQGFRFTHDENFPEEYKNDPELAETPEVYQEKEPVANENQGEQIINIDDQNSEEAQQQQQQDNQTPPANTEDPNQQENIKG